MLQKVVRKYSGLIFFYLTIVGMVLLVNYRVDNFNSQEEIVTYALSD